MTNYSRGAAFERKVKKQYEDQGCYVMRSAGSKGPVDLIAFEPLPRDVPIFIQCKLRKPTKRERESFIAFLDKYKVACQALLVWPDGEESV